MCGIVGKINFSGAPVSKAELKKMTSKIAHRGPDGEGIWLSKNIGLGHRRLAIIDTSDAARQPMVSQDTRYIICYNGEIYNFNEIKSELSHLGVKFKTKSDTEVVLNALATLEIA